MSKLFIIIIRAYQKYISPYKLSRGSCRFIPTCSNYCIEALTVHGFFKGTALSVYRVLRCNPFCKGGYDPVPPKTKKTSTKGRN